MYYRKYFAGTLSNTSQTKAVQLLGNTSANSTIYVNQTDLICNAVKETCIEAGIDCIYLGDGKLDIDGVSVQIVASNSNGGTVYRIQGYSSNLWSSTFAICSGASYKFYVTLKGDIDGILKICIGYFSSPSAETTGIVLGKGVDLSDGLDIRVVEAIGNVGNSYLRILKNNSLLTDYSNYIVFGQQFTNVAQLNGSGSEITLVECVAQTGRFKIDNCYFGSAALNVDEFYNIGGDIYYYLSKNILVKCANEQST